MTCPLRRADETMRLPLDLFGSGKELFEQRPRELLALDHVREARTDGHQKTSFPASLGPDLKDPGARAPLGGLYLRADEQTPRARRRHHRGRHVHVLRPPPHPAQRAASAGALVRTIVTCETCHRTLSSTIGVASSRSRRPPRLPSEARETPDHGRGEGRAETARRPGQSEGGAAKAEGCRPRNQKSTRDPRAGRNEEEVTAAAVAVDRLEKALGTNQVLRGISFEAQAGEIFGLLGPNGAGKTTTLRIICTLLSPDAGQRRGPGLRHPESAG